MNFLRIQDHLPQTNNLNIYWNQLLRTVDEFDQLIEMQKHEISNSIKQYYHKRLTIVKQFSQFKDSLRFVGEVTKKQLQIVEMEQFASFFKGYHHSIVEIIEKVILKPKVLVQLIALSDKTKYKIDDFTQNLAFNIYPCYLPLSRPQPNNFLQFIQAAIQLWSYSLDQVRPIQYTLIDQLITGYLKEPTIACYVQKIVSKFLKDASNCNMSSFTFDNQAIKSQINLKKQVNATFSFQEKKTWKDKLKGFFKGSKEQQIRENRLSQISKGSEIGDSFLTNQSDRSETDSAINEISRVRKTSIYDLIKNTVENILNEEPPFLLCKMMKYFHEKLQSQIQGKSVDLLKHYCYFLMTNLVLAELHNKFTMSHQENGMNQANLQNISQVIKNLNFIFQGIVQQDDKHRFNYKQKIEKYYHNMLRKAQSSEVSNNDDLREILLQYYQKSIILSFNDIKIIVNMLAALPKQSTLFEDREKCLSFLKNSANSQLFEIENRPKPVKFKNTQISAEYILFAYQNKSPSVKQVIDYYMSIEQPLQNIPLIKKLLLYESNLTVQEALEIDQDFRLLRKLPIREIRTYLLKISTKFAHLQIKDSRQLRLKFKQSFRLSLSKSLQRKEWLLFYRNEISSRMSTYSRLMNYYTKQLNSMQFYQRISNSFINSLKLKLYLNIQNDRFKVHRDTKQLKKIQISTLIVGKDDSKSTSSNQNYLLRNSFKLFQNVKDLMKCLAKNQITKAALNKGRQSQQFNEIFKEICQIVVSHIEQFIKGKDILQVLSSQKIAILVVKKMQDMVYSRAKGQRNKLLEKDKKLMMSCQKIDKELFYHKDIEQFGLDRQFLVQQGVEKFKSMSKEQNVYERMRQFSELFKIIFTVLGFTMAKNKISAEIITPLMQYIILECPQQPHHENLYSLQCLRWKQTPEESYNLTVYQSCLTYICQLMVNDYGK